jgi:hypothetical protein
MAAITHVFQRTYRMFQLVGWALAHADLIARTKCTFYAKQTQCQVTQN